MIQSLAQPRSLLHWMECLSDPTRLRLLRVLERHELGVAELCEILQLPQSTVSRHLKVLLDGQFVRNHRQATTHIYRMALEDLKPPAKRLWLLAREQTESWATCQQDQLRLDQRLRQRQAESQEFFAGAAGEWDKLRTELYGSTFSVAAMLSLVPSHYTVADLGCGTGPLVIQIAPYTRRVIGVDSSAAMLKAASKRTAHMENVELRRGDLAELPIDDECCDAALMVLALTYVPDAGKALREMARILKPGGKAIIVDLLPHDREEFRRELGQQTLGFEPQRMRSEMLACGLEEEKIRPLPPEAQAKGPALFMATAVRRGPGASGE